VPYFDWVAGSVTTVASVQVRQVHAAQGCHLAPPSSSSVLVFITVVFSRSALHFGHLSTSIMQAPSSTSLTMHGVITQGVRLNARHRA